MVAYLVVYPLLFLRLQPHFISVHIYIIFLTMIVIHNTFKNVIAIDILAKYVSITAGE